MSDAVTSQLPLETLALTIKAHVQKGDASIDKAEQHYKAAGIHLMEAKERIARRKDITWPAFLNSSCGVRRSRADELIAIANGSTSLAEIRENNRRRDATRRSRDVAARSSTVAHGKSPEKTQQNQQRPAQKTSDPAPKSERELILEDIHAELKNAGTGALREILASIQSINQSIRGDKMDA